MISKEVVVFAILMFVIGTKPKPATFLYISLYVFSH